MAMHTGHILFLALAAPIIWASKVAVTPDGGIMRHENKEDTLIDANFGKVDEHAEKMEMNTKIVLNVTTSANTTCGFESDLCSWSNLWSGIKWERKRGRTMTDHTGPSGAANGEYYLYAEAYARMPNENAWLGTLTYAKYLELYLNMYGATMGTFKVWTCSWKDGQCVDDWSVLHEESGNKGDVWRHVLVDLGPGEKSVVLNAVIGSGDKSDIAIDSVNLYNRR